MRRFIRLATPIWLLGVCALVAFGDVLDFQSLTLRSIPFTADRGTVTDTVIVGATLDSTLHTGGTLDTVVTIGGDTVTVYVSGSVTSAYVGGTQQVVVTRRKYVTSPEDSLVAFPSIYTAGDTSGQGVPCVYYGDDRHLWYIPDPDYMAYNVYEVRGDPDSLIAEVVDWPTLGKTAPEAFVADTSALADSVVTGRMLTPDLTDAGTVTFNRTVAEDSIRALYIDGTYYVFTPRILTRNSGMTPLTVDRHVLVGPNLQIAGDTLRWDPDDTAYNFGIIPRGLTATWNLIPPTEPGTIGQVLAISDTTGDDVETAWETAGAGTGDITSVGVLHDFLKTDADSSAGAVSIGLNLSDAPSGADSFLVSTGNGLRFSKGDGAGGGVGDITGVGTSHSFLTVDADSAAGNPNLGLNLTATDARYVNESQANAISSGMIATGAVADSTKIASGAVTTTRIAANGIYSGNIKDGQVKSGDLAAGAVADSTKIAAGAVTRTKIATGSISAVQIMDGQVKSAELASGAVADSTKLAASSVTTTRIAANAVYSDDIKDGQVKSGDLASGAVSDSTKIAAGSVTVTRIGSNAVYSTSIKDGQVKSGDLAAGAVSDSTKLATGSVTVTKIGTGAVYSTSIKDGQVKTADLAANSVDSTKVGAGTLALSDLKSTTAAAANEVLSATSTGVMNWQPLADGQLPSTITIGTGESIDVSGTGHIDATMVNVQARAVSGTIPAGSVVYAASYNPSGWLEVGLADANGSGTMPAIGIAEVQLTTGTGGSVITNGIIGGQDTDPGAIGPIFVSETAGAWTTTLPSTVGTEVQELGYIVRVHNSSGEILVNPIDTDEMQNLESAKFWVGNGSNRPTAVAMSNDATMANTGAVTIAANAVAAAELAAGAVADSTELGSGAVTATKIGANAIHTGHIKDGQVKSGDIAASAIADSTKLAAGAVTRTKIATGSITAVQIMDGQVKSGELAAGAVADSTKIGNSAVTATKIAASAVKNGNLGTGAVSSTKIAAGAVADSTKLGTGSVTVTKIGTGAVYSGSIKDGQVKSADLASGAIADSTKLAASSVTTTRIAANAVYSDDIKDGQVQSGDLAAGAIVDSTKLAASSVTTTKISANAVYSDDIKDGQVKTADIAASAIDSSKIATGAVTARTIKANDSPSNDEVLAYTKGDFYWTPAGAGDITGVGTSNDFLKVADSTSGNPKLGLYVTDAPAAADSFLVSTGSNLRFSKGTSGGDQVSVNSTATTNPDLDDAAPAAPSGGVNVKWQTASNNVSAYLDYNSSHIDAMRTKPWYFEDFIGALNSGAKIWPWSLSALASGSLAATEGTINHPGIQKVTSSSSSNSGMGISGNSADAIIFGGGECFEASVQFKRLKNVTVVVGFNDQWSGGDLESSADGGFAYFNTDSLLTLRSCENSTRADADTTYTVSRDTWYRIRVCTTSDGNRLDGWCWNDSGTLLWHESLTDNGSTILIPDDTGRSFTSGVCVVHETTTTGIPLLWVDYMAQWYNNRALTR